MSEQEIELAHALGVSEELMDKRAVFTAMKNVIKLTYPDIDVRLNVDERGKPISSDDAINAGFFCGDQFIKRCSLEYDSPSAIMRDMAKATSDL